ncbi:unnamed protein product, partial [marine sediment metagenome]
PGMSKSLAKSITQDTQAKEGKGWSGEASYYIDYPLR